MNMGDILILAVLLGATVFAVAICEMIVRRFEED